MAEVMIGVDPHKASHTAVVISVAEEALGELRVRACAGQVGQHPDVHTRPMPPTASQPRTHHGNPRCDSPSR
jgi:hypothetical protein